jgi:hypothetical protein
MPIYVVFENKNAGHDPDWQRKAFVGGPYAAADIVEGRLNVGANRGLEPRFLAYFDGRLWRVNDGMGDDGPTYECVRFLTRKGVRICFPDYQDEKYRSSLDDIPPNFPP